MKINLRACLSVSIYAFFVILLFFPIQFLYFLKFMIYFSFSCFFHSFFVGFPFFLYLLLVNFYFMLEFQFSEDFRGFPVKPGAITCMIDPYKILCIIWCEIDFLFPILPYCWFTNRCNVTFSMQFDVILRYQWRV